MELTDAEVARIVDKCAGSRDFVGNGVNHNFVEGTLKPLQEYLGLTIAELKKIVLSLPAVLSYNHDSLVNEKLEPLKRYLDLTDAELKKIVIRLPAVLSYNHDSLVNEKLEPLQRYLHLTDAELKKIVISFPAVLGLNHDSLVNEKLEPLQRHLGLTDAELKKIVVSIASVLGYNHDRVVKKLKLQQECLGYTDEEMRAEVVALPHALSYGNIEEKWALMNSGFAEEEGGQKLAALRRLGPRGLGVGLARLQDRLADLGALFGRAPKASEWFSRLAMYKPSRWENALGNCAREYSAALACYARTGVWLRRKATASTRLHWLLEGRGVGASAPSVAVPRESLSSGSQGTDR
jgi:mTERF domain-containing protein